MQRSGITDLPLHGGTVPRWLADRMTLLGTAIAETSSLWRIGVVVPPRRSILVSGARVCNGNGLAFVRDYDLGFGSARRGLNPRTQELGIYVCGGRGRHSRQTPAELLRYADATSLDGYSLGSLPVVWRHASTTMQSLTAFNSIFMDSLLPQTANGRSFSRE